MPTEGSGDDDDRGAIRAALSEAIAGSGADRADPKTLDAAGFHWLGIGLRLGVERPEAARRVLALLDAAEADHGPRTDVPVDEDRPAVDFRSTLLSRSAESPVSGQEPRSSQAMFGWAAGLSARNILAMGRVVDEMLATGSPADIGRGFGLAWDAGVRLPREELEAMIGEFAELQITVGGVLAGRDLRTGVVERRRGLAGLFDPWLARTSPTEAQASAVIHASGEPGQHGLVALWNAWAGLRFRAILPRPTFDLLVGPWRTVMGPLPGDEAGSETPSPGGSLAP